MMIVDKIARMKTVGNCLIEIKALDPKTDISEYFIRGLCLSGQVKHFKSGTKVYVNYDDLLRFLNFGEVTYAHRETI